MTRGMFPRPVAALLLAALAPPALALPAFTDGDFGAGVGTFGGWVTTGTVGTRGVSDLINGVVNPADASILFNIGLGDYFTTGNFAVLGDVFGPIGDAPDTGTHTLSRTFALAAGATYDLEVRFRSVMDGRAPPDDSYCDFFEARLDGPAGYQHFFFQRTFCNGDGQFDQQAFVANLADLAAGDYTLTFRLVEGPDFDTLNTAAGVDNVSVDYTATPVPSTTQVPLPLWTGGLLAFFASLMVARRRLPSAKRAM